ncbi:alcohol dehydrogenase [Hypoxylon sp. FL1284]|nr:alcohol dehydrogenase [Hypoxylon sp. FL1284]
MSRDIKAWTFTHGGYPNALQQTVLPLATGPPKPTEIRVRTKAASINPVDVQLMSYPLLSHIPGFLVPPQKGVGEDFAGVVEKAGAGSGFKRGDEVFGIGPFVPTGTLQEVVHADLKTSVVARKPAPWSWGQAAALPLVWLTARTAIARVETHVARGNKRVAVLGGSSSCGMYAVRMARQRGWAVAATCSARNADFVRGLGADETIDYATADVGARVRGFAPDAVIDFVGGTAGLAAGAPRYVTFVGDKTDRAAPGGRYIYLWNPRMLLRALAGRVGVGPEYTCANLEFNADFLTEALSLAAEDIVVDSVFSFGDVREALDKLVKGRVRGKIVITFGEGDK